MKNQNLDNTKALILSEIKEQLHEMETLVALDRIHDLLLDAVDAERLCLYGCDQRTIELFSILKTGNEVDEIRVGADLKSVVGFCVATQQTLSISDVRDKKELKAIDPRVQFDASWDKKTGIRTLQLLCAPILYGNDILGALQFVNCRDKHVFDEQDEFVIGKITSSLAQVMVRFITAPDENELSDIPENSRDKILDVLRRHKISMPGGAVPAIEKLIKEHKEMREKLDRYKELLSD